MATLTLKNVPEELVEQLKDEAKQESPQPQPGGSVPTRE